MSTCGLEKNGRRVWATSGVRKATDTMREMQRHVRGALSDRRVLETAAGILEGTPVRDYAAHAAKLREWVKDHVRFTRDPNGREMLRCPGYLLDRIDRHGLVEGDCDDVAVLSASLGKAVGFPADFVALAFDPTGKRYQHVYSVLYGPDGTPFEMDTTKADQYIPPRPTGFLRLRV